MTNVVAPIFTPKLRKVWINDLPQITTYPTKFNIFPRGFEIAEQETSKKDGTKSTSWFPLKMDLFHQQFPQFNAPRDFFPQNSN